MTDIPAFLRSLPTSRLAELAVVFETWFVLALCALHLLRPDLTPARHMISEYAVGPFGALMTSAFVAAALACLSLLLGLIRDGPDSRPARFAELLLAVAFVGLLISAIFPMDVRPPYTRSGAIHELSFLVNVSCMLLAALLLAVSFGADPRWHPFRRTALTLALLQLAALVLQVVTIATRNSWGLANRLFVVVAVSWLVATALWLRKVAAAPAR
jgi:uncharacterized protein DUF998